jgi:SPP1 family predicted phage head-tail adaptor
VALNIGSLVHSITLENPSAQTADGDGGYAETWTELDPSPARASIKASAGRTGERRVANTVVAQGTHEVVMRYHPDVSTRTRITFVDKAGNTRTLQVTDVDDVDSRGQMLRLTCVEVTTS